MAFHFKSYEESQNGNYNVNKKFLMDIQKEIFHYEEHKIEQVKKIYSVTKDEVDIKSNGVDILRGTYNIIGNKVTKHLLEVWDYLKNEAYLKRGEKERKMKIKYKEKIPTVKEYNDLMDQIGWGLKSEKIVKEALNNTLYSLCVYDNDRLVGYGRIIGDKTMFLYIQDIIVIPEYQRKQIGSGIMNKLLKQIEKYRKLNPNVRTYLGASKGKEGFYQKFGFVSRPNEELGAGMILKNENIH